MSSQQKAIRALRLFNEKAERLQNSRFVRTVFEENTGFTISFGKDTPVTIEAREPDQEAIDAFVLTLRFFIQDNEPSSFRNLAQVYESLPNLEEAKERFKYDRERLNEFLDSTTMFKINGEDITNRRIFEVFVFGGLAHANEEKKQIYDAWMQMPLVNRMLDNEFVVILAQLMNCISYVHQLNTEVIAELEKA